MKLTKQIEKIIKQEVWSPYDGAEDYEDVKSATKQISAAIKEYIAKDIGGEEEKANEIVNHFFQKGARVGVKDFDYVKAQLAKQRKQQLNKLDKDFE